MKELDSEKCPICQKESNAQYFPFCSKRCADIDLHRWFSGVYRTPIVQNDDDEEIRTINNETILDDDKNN